MFGPSIVRKSLFLAVVEEFRVYYQNSGMRKVRRFYCLLQRFQIRMFAEVDDFRWLQMQSEHVIILPFKQDLVVKCAALGLYAVPELN